VRQRVWPTRFLLQQKGVYAATEELSQGAAAEDEWADWEGITDALDSRQWLQHEVVITRGMVQTAAARFLDEFKQVRNMRLGTTGRLQHLAAACGACLYL
jgi:hypothetical protein